MDDVALHIEQDIAIVAILEFQHVGEDGGTDQRFYEALLGLLHVVLKDILEELGDADALGLLLHLVHRNRVRYELQNTGVFAKHDYLVGLDEGLHAGLANDIPHFVDELHADDLLPEVIPALYHYIPEPEALEPAEIGFHAVLELLQLPGLAPDRLDHQVAVLELALNVGLDLVGFLGVGRAFDG